MGSGKFSLKNDRYTGTGQTKVENHRLKRTYGSLNF